MAKVKEYNAEDDWEQYVERLEFHFVAHDITDEGKKKATLLSVCGAQTYKLMCGLVAHLKPKDKTFKELKELVQKHLKPKPSVIVQRYKFNTRGQHAGESVSCFVAGLRHVAQECNFGAQLSDMLRDRLVCGVISERVQRRLLAEPELTFDKAFSLATAMETAERNASELQTKFSGAGEDNSADSNMAAEQINKLEGSRSKDKTKIECWFCEKYGHMEKECRLKQKLERKMFKEKERSKREEADSEQVNYESQSDSEGSYPIWYTQGWYVEGESDGEDVNPPERE